MKSKNTFVDYRLWKTHLIIHFEEHSIFSTLLAFKDAFWQIFWPRLKKNLKETTTLKQWSKETVLSKYDYNMQVRLFMLYMWRVIWKLFLRKKLKEKEGNWYLLPTMKFFLFLPIFGGPKWALWQKEKEPWNYYFYRAEYYAT